MKHLKIFEDFKVGLPTEEIDRVKFNSLLNQNCQNFLKVMNDINYDIWQYRSRYNFLFRKFKEDLGNFVFTKPSDSESKRIAPWSGNYGNYHNLLVSNLESWTSYPTRNKSLICAGYNRAVRHSGYNLYLVIPYDTTEIGVCPTDEFWFSFRCYNEKRQLLPQWVSGLINLVASMNLDSWNTRPKLSDTDWSELVPYLDKNYESELFIKYKYFDNYDEEKTLLENINDYLDPKSNGFKLSDYINLVPQLKSSGVECWFGDESIMVNWNWLQDLTRKEIKSLFS